MLRKLDRRFAKLGKERTSYLEGLDQFGEQAYSMITSSRTRASLRHQQGDRRSFARQFGDESFGQSCLLALASGGIGGSICQPSARWLGYPYRDNFTKLKDTNLPKLDAGLSGLLIGLEQRGLLDSTAVLCHGRVWADPEDQ